MKRSYYLFTASELERKDNTIKVTLINNEDNNKEQVKYLPVEHTEDLYILTSVRLNSNFLNFCGKNAIPVHFFDYYEHYTASLMPRETLISGNLLVNQVNTYKSAEERIKISRQFLSAGTFNLLRNLKYYRRKGADLQKQIDTVNRLSEKLQTADNINALMGIEGNIRQIYYSAFTHIIKGLKEFKRVKRPPSDKVNSLISFGNSLLYAQILTQIYRTQLSPAISFLHEPGERRFSLALDISEVFKPLLVDRLIFRMLNRGELNDSDFENTDGVYLLKDKGRKKFVSAWDENLKTLIHHRKLDRKVSYRRLIRLELYKLVKHILAIEPYEPFKIWW